ncbi:MAG: membrane dipeptidase [Planctomycetota bacterium]
MNEAIEKAKQAALEALKPSPKDLQHGLELHANTVVCESYGFTPRAAVDGTALAAAVEAGASDIELQDMREEMMMLRVATDPADKKEFIEAWDAAGVTCIGENSGEENQAPLTIIKRLARFNHLTDLMPDYLVRAAWPQDITRAKKEGKRCLYLNCNGVPLTQNWLSVQDELRYIRVFFQLGCRMMHLTYNRRNMLGDGCAEPDNAGLSDFGRAVIAEMNRVGVIVDTAHSGWKTTFEAAKASASPMVISHSGCCALNEHIRCKPDAVIRAVCDTGGYIGICCIPNFLGGTGDINAFLDHIEYVVKHFGADRVAIGTDISYVSSRAAEENKKAPPRRKERKRWENFWPENAFATKFKEPRYPQSLAWTNWPYFTVGLVQRGHSDDDVQKIIGGNVLRVAQAVLDHAKVGPKGK